MGHWHSSCSPIAVPGLPDPDVIQWTTRLVHLHLPAGPLWCSCTASVCVCVRLYSHCMHVFLQIEDTHGTV